MRSAKGSSYYSAFIQSLRQASLIQRKQSRKSITKKKTITDHGSPQSAAKLETSTKLKEKISLALVFLVINIRKNIQSMR